jgi:hypothetical protein
MIYVCDHLHALTPYSVVLPYVDMLGSSRLWPRYVTHTPSVGCGRINTCTGYDMANQTAYLDGMLRWGLDWMIKAHPSNSTLYVQVGDSKSSLVLKLKSPLTCIQVVSTTPIGEEIATYRLPVYHTRSTTLSS